MTFKQLRQRVGTQDEFSKLLGLKDKTVVSKWENGANYPKTKDLKRIADLLGVTVTELLVALEEGDKNVQRCKG